MSYSAEMEILAVEEEDIGSTTLMDKPFNPKDIDIQTKTMSLDNIIKRLAHDDIDLNTEFQRKGNLWDSSKQSRLIESILINFPLPAFYFDGSNDNKWLVVDGLQRLSALKNFVVNNTLKLQGLEFLDKLHGKHFNELSRSLQRQIEEAQIIAYIINPGTPHKVKFNIFKRINTGGLILTSQEIRHALNQGIPAKFVKELADLDSFIIATQHSIKPDRMMDREFVTRYMAFYLNNPEEYKPDLDTFLNEAMLQIANMTWNEREKAKTDFNESMNLAHTVFGKWAFRKVFNKKERRKPINKALFEVWSVSFASLSDLQKNTVKDKKKEVFDSFITLMNSDNKFFDSISSATGDKSRIIYRFKCINNLLNNIIS